MQVSEKIYKECRQKVFGKRQILSWHKRKIPTLKAVNLIFKATSQRIGTSVDVKGNVAFLCSVLFEFHLLFFGFSWIKVYGLNRRPVSCFP